MPGAGELEERITLQRRALDANGDREGDWADEITRWAQVIWLKGSETVINARLQGLQPAVLVVVDEEATRLVDNSWRAVGVTPRIAGMIFDIKAAAPAKDPGYRDLTVEQNGALGGP